MHRTADIQRPRLATASESTAAEMVMGGLGAALLWLVWVGAAFGYSVPKPQDSEGEEVYCECVPYYLCQDGVIITDGRNVIDIRTSRQRTPVTNVKACPSVIDVCCGLPPSLTTTTSTITPMTSSTLPPVTLPPTLPPDTPCRCVGILECPCRAPVPGRLLPLLRLRDHPYTHVHAHAHVHRAAV
ncbi:hypothetical protein O3P69_020119 [Scylla paramamosain]|uniref:PPAF-2-like Clip domain-containing protein n=1 Tax=Scylla paramamosain TaxID=85552 RepID=A0AAW0TJW4_SCYPA